MIQNFRVAIGADADSLANGGRGKLALLPDMSGSPPLLRLSCRDTRDTPLNEQDLLDHTIAVVNSQNYAFSRALVIDYYVSLKTNPFVILTGAEGRGKTDFARLFAEALVGRNSSQYALISGGTSWHSGTGEDSYYRSLQERFGSWRFLDLLQEAADPANAGKAYLICFDALQPDELEYYFATLLQITPSGQKQLNLPGFPPDRQPIIPPNVYMTATVNVAEHTYELSPHVLRRAGLIEFRAPPRPRALAAHGPYVAAPAAGYQRLWLRAALHDIDAARARLARVLGPDQTSRLRSSTELARLLWRGGIVFSTKMLHELTNYIANSFDEQGRGLFDPHDPQRNARIAFDAQVVQRVLWQLRISADSELRRDLADYLDRAALMASQQAVA